MYIYVGIYIHVYVGNTTFIYSSPFLCVFFGVSKLGLFTGAARSSSAWQK